MHSRMENSTNGFSSMNLMCTQLFIRAWISFKYRHKVKTTLRKLGHNTILGMSGIEPQPGLSYISKTCNSYETPKPK